MQREGKSRVPLSNAPWSGSPSIFQKIEHPQMSIFSRLPCLMDVGLLLVAQHQGSPETDRTCDEQKFNINPKAYGEFKQQ